MSVDIPVFFIDASALKDIFNGQNEGHSKELLEKLKDLQNKGEKIKAVTSLSNFLRAIWIANPDAKINDIQKTLSFLEVGFSMSDFKNEKEVLNETLRIVQSISGGNKNG